MSESINGECQPIFALEKALECLHFTTRKYKLFGLKKQKLILKENFWAESEWFFCVFWSLERTWESQGKTNISFGAKISCLERSGEKPGKGGDGFSTRLLYVRWHWSFYINVHLWPHVLYFRHSASMWQIGLKLRKLSDLPKVTQAVGGWVRRMRQVGVYTILSSAFSTRPHGLRLTSPRGGSQVWWNKVHMKR